MLFWQGKLQMNINLTDKNLSKIERLEVGNILARQSSTIPNDLEQMWYLMDLIWDDYSCNNKKLNWDYIGKFYSHSVWLLNGLFLEQDEVSMGHRHAISDWVIKHGFKNIVDYGGGFGTLARLIAEKESQAMIDIYEPHPSEFGLKRAGEFININIVDQLSDNYDVLLSTDVLEHVPDPLNDFSKMIDSVQVGGYLVIANCFYPVIKCHLPQDFHFRYTFNIFARLMGLQVCGNLKGSHATIFKKYREKKINWFIVRSAEFISQFSFPLIVALIPVLRPIKRFIFK
jgi:2-polyprenyl-6-hydroxyphenyl methylase/3-demethylubiquinone-9 3-methyltransferase